VGPSLGSDSINSGRKAMFFGLIAVMIFMIIYYKGAGLLATLALMLNLIMVIAVLAGLGATLTLPGIAGLILTIGMAVDANVIIFERIREELDWEKLFGLQLTPAMREHSLLFWMPMSPPSLQHLYWHGLVLVPYRDLLSLSAQELYVPCLRLFLLPVLYLCFSLSVNH